LNYERWKNEGNFCWNYLAYCNPNACY
jgi:hypothetical protein